MTYTDLLDLARTDRRNLFNFERLKEGMTQRGMDAVIAISTINLTYTGGSYMRPVTGWQRAVVTTQSGAQGLIINESDAIYFREYSWIDDIRGLRASGGPNTSQVWLEMVTEMLADMGLRDASIGIEQGHLPSSAMDSLRQALPNARWADCEDVFEYARLVKTPGEIDLFRLAADYTMKAIQVAWALSRPGDTEKTVAARMQAAVLELGADALTHCHLHSGAHGTITHSWPMEKRLEPGEVVHIDFGGIFGGYHTDLSRNAVVVAGTPRQDAIYRHLWETEQKLIEMVRPGLPVREMWDLCEREFNKAGLVYPWSMIGHSTGLDVHEGFEISSASDVILEPGMIINLEPTHIEPNDARYHVEDSVVVTETGYELLTDILNTPEMFVIK